MKRSILGSDGHGRRHALPTLATNLAMMDHAQMAAPYLNHIGLAAPYLAASVPEFLPGLLLPTIGSPKPPSARKAPTRVNLFKASNTLSIEDKCGGCSVFNGTVIVTHFGFVPPQTFLCYTVKRGGCEQLIPYMKVRYQEDPARQFTYAANAASSISLEITSFAANNPLNGQATSAHVMDIDDICTYSSGTFELRSTTPKDAVSSTSLANGLIGIMGPESYSETLLHPYHCGTKTYPGWSIAVEAKADATGNCLIHFADFTDHRWFVDTTFQVTVTGILDDPAHDYNSGGVMNVYLNTTTGTCPPQPQACAVGLDLWGATDSNARPIATACLKLCPPAKTTSNITGTRQGNSDDSPGTPMPTQDAVSFPDPPAGKTHKLFLAWKRDVMTVKKAIKCAKPCEPDDTCTLEEVPDCPDSETPSVICCKDPPPTVGEKLKLGWPYNQVVASGTYTTCSTENAYGITVDWSPCNSEVKLKCARIEIRTLTSDPQQQFGPAIVTRLEGLTKDIIIQLNIRSAVAGIQTGEARSVAPPTGPSMTGLGEEDAILVQAQFDDPSTRIARVMNTTQYRSAAEALPEMHREHAASLMEAAPIGDTIRGIAGTISRIGHSIGGPLGTIGDIVGTVGNVAGTIGDAIGSIFSAPAAKRPRLLFAAPTPRYREFMANPIDMTIGDPRTYNPQTGSASPTPLDVEKSVREFFSWSISLNRIWKMEGSSTKDTYQSFPWALPDNQVSGVSRIYITSQPMTLPDRPKPMYRQYQTSKWSFFMDEYLVGQNDQAYVYEAIVAMLTGSRKIAFVTTDAQNYIYGDSFSAAILTALLAPNPLTAITGGIKPFPHGGIRITPVGMIPEKIKAAMEAGLILVAPMEDVTTALRQNSAGTEVVSVNDILLGLLTQTPSLITVSTPADILAAQSFVGASSKTPIGEAEIADKQAQVDSGMAKSQEIEAIRQRYKQQPEATAEELALLKVEPFNVDVPGFGIQPVPLLDIDWWNQRQGELTLPTSQKGMGIPMSKIDKYIQNGDIHRLTGLALGILSRELASARKASGGRQKKTTSSSRLPPYKRPATTQIASLIERLRQQRQPEAEEMEAAPYSASAPKRRRFR